jgi:hypothetical protein
MEKAMANEEPKVNNLQRRVDPMGDKRAAVRDRELRAVRLA